MVTRLTHGRAVITKNSLESATNSTADVLESFLKYNIQNGCKTTFVVVSYSQLYEEGNVEHINCPHPPS